MMKQRSSVAKSKSVSHLQYRTNSKHNTSSNSINESNTMRRTATTSNNNNNNKMMILHSYSELKALSPSSAATITTPTTPVAAVAVVSDDSDTGSDCDCSNSNSVGYDYYSDVDIDIMDHDHDNNSSTCSSSPTTPTNGDDNNFNNNPLSGWSVGLPLMMDFTAAASTYSNSYHQTNSKCHGKPKKSLKKASSTSASSKKSRFKPSYLLQRRKEGLVHHTIQKANFNVYLPTRAPSRHSSILALFFLSLVCYAVMTLAPSSSSTTTSLLPPPQPAPPRQPIYYYLNMKEERPLMMITKMLYAHAYAFSQPGSSSKSSSLFVGVCGYPTYQQESQQRAQNIIHDLGLQNVLLFDVCPPIEAILDRDPHYILLEETDEQQTAGRALFTKEWQRQLESSRTTIVIKDDDRTSTTTTRRNSSSAELLWQQLLTGEPPQQQSPQQPQQQQQLQAQQLQAQPQQPPVAVPPMQYHRRLRGVIAPSSSSPSSSLYESSHN